MLEPSGSSASVSPSRAQRASRTSTRSGMAAMTSPSGCLLGRSLREWMATSHSPLRSAMRSAAAKTPVPPSWDSGPAVTSPSVLMRTIL